MVRNRESWNAHRFMVFFFSARGQRRIFNFMFKVMRFFWRSIFGGKEVDDHVYHKWVKMNTPGSSGLKRFRAESEAFSYRPLISIVIPVYKPVLEHLREALNSILDQVYDVWEVCLVDDASGMEELEVFLTEMAEKEPRIHLKFRKENGHISACSNDASDMAKGDYLAFLDQDDLLSPDALYHVVRALNERGHADLIYSDEDKVNEEGLRRLPHFKPDYAPHNLLSRNYFGHLVVVSTKAFSQVGKFRIGYEGSQDYDLWLRITELGGPIFHLARVLYHWRMHELSTAGNESAKNYAFENGEKALNDAMKRRGVEGRAELLGGAPGVYRIHYELKEESKVSVIIPTKDRADVLSTCIESVFGLTDYSNFEVLVVDNNSSEDSFRDLMDNWKVREPERFRVLEEHYPFNFSKLINAAASASNGDYLLFLNNDTEVIQKNWMREMLSHAQQKDVGAVGVKLLFPNDTVQHAGVVIGIQGLAGHTFVAAPRDEAGYYYYLKAVSDYSAVTAACMMVSRKNFDLVGGFEEDLAVEYNDVDFCLKLIEAGRYNLFLGHVELYHYESLTRGHPHANREVYKRHKKEVKYYTEKWKKHIDNDAFYNPNLTRITTYFEPNIHG